ncbi:MAG: cob(I)yrinic acid a,c-diamide adenosyltransferase [Flavobacteriaceae bacterium]|nr:cob(I)yrinic acid a,c-diamide adenosyltransferase [Flavobacteriaceae bacterium]
MKIYTKTGDLGTTGLFGGTRVSKANLRIESYGSIDELNAWIGYLRDQIEDQTNSQLLIDIQNKLFVIGAILATDPEKQQLKSGKQRLDIERISAGDIEQLEKAIDAMDEELPPMTHFILPGGNSVVSCCHIARTVCRRAERRCIALYEVAEFDREVLMYLNRLSDYLFVLSRSLSKQLQAEETPWIPKKA